MSAECEANENVRSALTAEPDETIVQTRQSDFLNLFPRELENDPVTAYKLAKLSVVYGLDPFAGHLIPLNGQPYITFEGRCYKTHQLPEFGGPCEDRPATAEEYQRLKVKDEGMVVWYYSVHRLGWPNPVGRFGFAGGRGEMGTLARQKPQALARKRAVWGCYRDFFPMPLKGISQDEDIAMQTGFDPETGEIIRPLEIASPKQLKAIHTLRRLLDWDDEYYHNHLRATYQITSSKELTIVQAAAFFAELAEAVTAKLKRKPSSVDLDQVARIFGDEDHQKASSPPQPAEKSAGSTMRVIELRKRFTSLYNQIRRINQRILSEQGEPIVLKALPLSASEHLISQRIAEMENTLTRRGIEVIKD